MKTKNLLSKWLVIAALLLIALAGATIIVTASNSPQAITLYVRQGGTGDCATWANACQLQPALDLAAPGDEIWVAQGVYTPTQEVNPGYARSVTFQLENGVALYGGFPITGTPGWEDRNWQTCVTVLSGDIDGNDITDPHGIITDTSYIVGENSYHVVTSYGVTETAVLDGFTITGGDAYGGVGGGMTNVLGGPVLTNLTFSGNMATYSGGGMYNNSGSPVLTSVSFSRNTAVTGGGMINIGRSPVLTSVTFISNTAEVGGGMANEDGSPVLTGVTFSGNTAYGGGGMANISYELPANPKLENVTFSGNTAVDGGGMYNNNGSPVLTSVTFISNMATSSGGAILNSGGALTVTGGTFTNNHADIDGGGIFNSEWCNLIIAGSTFSMNSVGDDGGGIWNSGTLTLTHSSLSDNQALYYSGGIQNEGWMYVQHSQVLSNTALHGGGMMNTSSGILTFTDSTLADNHTPDYGGGILNAGTLTITRSTLAGNYTTAYYGGGIYSVGRLSIAETTFSSNQAATMGGAIINSGPATILNSSFSANEASYQGGGIMNTDTLTITSTTFYNNDSPDGGGIYNQGTIILAYTILANDISLSNCAGAVTDGGHNLDSGETCGFSPANDSKSNTDPMLAALADNGGPTLTHALLTGSPAIDAADPYLCPATDQRGVPRPVDGDGDGNAVCDIGAFEYQLPTITHITSDDPDPSRPGETFSVTFTVTSTLGTPTGAVTVTVGGSTETCSASLVNGQGGCQLILSAMGAYTLTASYEGDDTFAPSRDSEEHTVGPYKVYLPVVTR